MVNCQNIGKITLLLLFLSLLNSCKTRKDLLYLQDIQDMEEQSVPGKSPEYRIKPDDNLFVNINTLDPAVARLFNMSNTPNSGVTYQAYGNTAGQYINGYVVNRSGAIFLPIIGNVMVADKSASEVEMIIQEKANLYLKDAVVSVKVLSFKVTLLGEFNNPGVYYNYGNSMSLLEAIGMAGGVTENAQLSQLLVVRRTPTGSKSFRLDLSQKKILGSDAYYLEPNDVIYANADKLKNIRLSTPTYSFLLSAVTSFLVILQYLKMN